MNILLTTASAPEQTPFFLNEKRPPLGLGFLHAVLKKKGHRVFFLDNYLKPEHFIQSRYLQSKEIDIVGISVNTICFQEALKMIEQIERQRKQGRWAGKIIVGGPHASVVPESLPACVDYIIQGEGEHTIVEALEGSPKRVIRSAPIEDINSLPMPAWDVFLQLPYQFDAEWIDASPVFTMNTSRGCPFDCAFCSVGSVWGKRYRAFSAERVVEDISYVVRAFGVKGIYFREDNFTLQKKRVEAICSLLLQKGLTIKWMCESRVDTLDEDLLKIMKQSGCEAIYFGVESGSQRMLDFLRKGISIEQIENVFYLCHKLHIRPCASFLVGIPTETEAERQQTITFSKKLNPAVSWINVFVGIPKSPLYEIMVEKKLYAYCDNCGLLYGKEHNKLVDRFYGGDPKRKIPRAALTSKIRDFLRKTSHY